MHPKRLFALSTSVHPIYTYSLSGLSMSESPTSEPPISVQPLSGLLNLDQLKNAVTDKHVDTVIVAIVDMQGRLMGKRFHAQHFIDSAWKETHCCDYLLATDIEMATPDGFASTSWESGYGDYIMKPDMQTLRIAPWAAKSAMVLCDVLDHHTHAEVEHSPRAVLKKQIARLDELGYQAMAATELEFFTFQQSYDELRDIDYKEMKPISAYNEDYHIFQTAKEEGLMRDIRNQLFQAGIPVENTKGEAEAGQAELNITYSDALNMADNHSIAKNAVKEIAYSHNRSVTFLAKYSADTVGSSSHVHQSLQTKDGAQAFYNKSAEHGMSDTMKHYLAGQLQHASELTPFLAPYINSYKRFAPGTFAPTKVIWSIDNRTAAYRVVGADTPGVRFECRIGGSDINPYLAMAAIIAAGIAGIENKLELSAAFSGDAYAAKEAKEIPTNLHDAAAIMSGSNMLRAAFGDKVIDHYVHAANWEVKEFSKVVTDYEIKRGFERA